ncbi:MAG: choice-of-anchor tandem repeat GloVer-containing protein [Rhizomicrobium sp.]
MPRKNYTLLNIATIGSLVIAALATANGLAVSPVKAATFQTLHSFAGGAEGAVPYGRMVFDAKTGLLYGTTVSEGAGNGGTVFQFNPSTQALTTLYSFTLGGKKGSNPQTPLILSKKGVLYGVTTSGGGSSACNFGCGTIFKLNLATKQLKTLYAFSDQSDGGTPEAGLVFDSAQSTVFGTTVQGGDFVDCQIGCGTVYKLVLATKSFSSLHAFRSIADDGADSTAGMVIDGNGILYGTASEGGPARLGHCL